jgi:hypothetical protein
LDLLFLFQNQIKVCCFFQIISNLGQSPISTFMAPPQIPKTFRFKPIFPLDSPTPEDQASSSTPLKPLPFVSCVVVSSNDDRGKTIVVDLVGKTPYGKNKKLYEHAQKFQNTWTAWLPWAKLIFDDKG